MMAFYRSCRCVEHDFIGPFYITISQIGQSSLTAMISHTIEQQVSENMMQLLHMLRSEIPRTRVTSLMFVPPYSSTSTYMIRSLIFSFKL
jgi:hypothetical protein